MVTVASIFLYVAFGLFFLLLILDLIYSIVSRRRGGRVGKSDKTDKTYKSTGKLMKDNSSAPSKFPPILHYDESIFKKKGGGDSDL